MSSAYRRNHDRLLTYLGETAPTIEGPCDRSCGASPLYPKLPRDTEDLEI